MSRRRSSSCGMILSPAMMPCVNRFVFVGLSVVRPRRIASVLVWGLCLVVVRVLIFGCATSPVPRRVAERRRAVPYPAMLPALLCVLCRLSRRRGRSVAIVLARAMFFGCNMGAALAWIQALSCGE